MARKVMIGAVGFGKRCSEKESPRGWKCYPICGAERVRLLTKAMNGEELPDDLFLIRDTGSGWEHISRDEVNWDAHKLYLENKLYLGKRK